GQNAQGSADIEDAVVVGCVPVLDQNGGYEKSRKNEEEVNAAAAGPAEIVEETAVTRYGSSSSGQANVVPGHDHEPCDGAKAIKLSNPAFQDIPRHDLKTTLLAPHAVQHRFFERCPTARYRAQSHWNWRTNGISVTRYRCIN